MKQPSGPVNVPIAVASLGISMMLFVIVLPTWMSKRERPFTIALKGVPYGFDTTHMYIDKQPASIKVRANVTDKEYEDYNEAATAEADLTNAEPGTKQYPVSIYPDKFRKLIKDIPMATYTLEKIQPRDVAVMVNRTGKMKDPNLIVDKLKPDTDKVTIEGPSSAVSRVVSARATLKLDLLDAKTNQQLVALEPVDIQGRVVDRVEIHPAQVIVTPSFSQAPQQKQVFVLATFDDNELPPGYIVKNYFVDPKRVIATGSSFDLSRLASVTTEKIDVSKLTASQTLVVPLKMAGTGLSFSPSSVRVTIIVEQMSLKSLSPKTSSNRPMGRTPETPSAPK